MKQSSSEIQSTYKLDSIPNCVSTYKTSMSINPFTDSHYNTKSIRTLYSPQNPSNLQKPIEASNGDEALEYPISQEFSYNYPDFKYSTQFKKELLFIKCFKSEIDELIRQPFDDESCEYSDAPQKPYLVLEINNVLVHMLEPSQSTMLPQITIHDDGVLVSKLVIRPFAFDFLSVLQQFYSIILYTNYTYSIAKQILGIIDSKGEVFQNCYYRDSCIKVFNGFYAKDLRMIGDLSRIVLVDSSILSFIMQPENGLIVKSFNGDPNDRSLLPLMSYLIEIKSYEDLKVPLETKFDMKQILK